jgi:hypothetical protein
MLDKATINNFHSINQTEKQEKRKARGASDRKLLWSHAELVLSLKPDLGEFSEIHKTLQFQKMRGGRRKGRKTKIKN